MHSVNQLLRWTNHVEILAPQKMNHQSQIIQNQSKTRSPNQSHTLYLTQCSVKRFVALDTSIENRRQVGVANFDTTRYYQIDWASLPVVVVVAPSDLLFPAYWNRTLKRYSSHFHWLTEQVSALQAWQVWMYNVHSHSHILCISHNINLVGFGVVTGVLKTVFWRLAFFTACRKTKPPKDK